MSRYEDILVLKDKVSESLQRINKGFKNVQEQGNKVQSKLASLQMKMTTFGATAKKTAVAMRNFAMAGVAIGAGVLAVTNKVADAGDRIDKMSQKIGMSRKAFQEWDFIMSQNGGNVETLQMGFKTLATQMNNVQKGSKQSIKAFSDLGVKVKDNNGKFRSQDEVFNEVIKKLQKIQDPTKKAILANQLFGRSAIELKPLLNAQAESIDNLREKANAMGMILSDEDVDNAVKFKDTMDATSRVFQAKFATQVMKIMPYLTEALEWTANTGLPAITNAFVAVVSGLQTVSGAIGTFIGKIISIPTYISIAINTALTNINIFIINLIKKIMQLRDMIMNIGANLVGGAKNLAKNVANNINNSKTTNNNKTYNQATNNNQTYNTTNNNNNTTINNNYNMIGNPKRIPAMP